MYQYCKELKKTAAFNDKYVEIFQIIAFNGSIVLNR
jgi:hypothetical protein